MGKNKTTGTESANESVSAPCSSYYGFSTGRPLLCSGGSIWQGARYTVSSEWALEASSSWPGTDGTEDDLDRTFLERARGWLNSGNTASRVSPWQHPKDFFAKSEKQPHELHPKEYEVFSSYWRDLMEDRVRVNGRFQVFDFFGTSYRIRHDYKSPDGESWCDFQDMTNPTQGPCPVVLRIDVAQILIRNMVNRSMRPVTEELFAELLIAHTHHQ